MKRKVTPQQKKIANLVAKGKSNKEIAEELDMAPGTLRIHQQHMRQTTGESSTNAAAEKIVKDEE
jgi:DNA-binding NarL/FixJ family response regulator